jgi:hypothetical protein
MALDEEFVDNAAETFDEDALDEDENIFITPTLTSGPDDPEKTPICLPSHFHVDTFSDRSMRTFVKQEIKLREGQANDALQGLRLCLSRKSVLYRMGLRPQKTKKGKARPRQDISEADANVRHFARVYTRARN